jgi:hypothetical protein
MGGRQPDGWPLHMPRPDDMVQLEPHPDETVLVQRPPARLRPAGEY